MGCLGSKEESDSKATETNEKPTYSWEKRPRLDPKDYSIIDVTGETVGKLPGEINGQQFIIQNCQNCNIFILDHTDSIQVDDCTDCRIAIGPCSGSVFFRDCKECQVVVACQQFRTRDCKKMDFFLCCATQPVIESSSGMKFGCYQYYYRELASQFEAANLSVFNNNWSSIFDFTPAAGETTWILLPEDARLSEYMSSPDTEKFANVVIAADESMSVVPLTLGSRRKRFDECCLVVFFYEKDVQRRVKDLLYEQKQRSCVLVQTKEIEMKPEDVERIFQSEDYKAAAEKGPVIGLEFNSKDCVRVTNEAVRSIFGDSPPSIYVSPTPDKAPQDIDAFYNFVDMSMTSG
ncbi:protein XRP2-like [Acropora millepora]|uniref:protein XRP2-like n=1 Tax=Acropora millepora TaxID=45264 RepID=UPI001CF493F6|nr:protein XRP2-like [Acropora millepora]